MKNKPLVDEWLRRARSNLERAKAGKASDKILFEDLCFDCQQAVEKSIKALLVHLDIEFERIHSISTLLKQIENVGITVPQGIKGAAELSIYAVSTRYPGDYEPVTESEYKEALVMTKKVIKWAERTIAHKQTNAKDENDK